MRDPTDDAPTYPSAPCPIPFVPARHFTVGRIAPGAVTLIVLHTMEAAEKPSTAELVAAWFGGAAAPRASAHYCVDSDTIVQCVREDDTAWHAPGANHNGIGIEHAGYARQTAEQWADPYSERMLRLSARLSAEVCARHEIPIAFVDVAGLRGGKSGITTHHAVSLAFRKSTHTDPGEAFPVGWYLYLVRRFAAGLGPAV